MRKLTGLLTIGGGIEWQYFGDASWDDEEGVTIGFPLFTRVFRRQALRAVQSAVEHNEIEWLRVVDGRWFVDLDLLRSSVEPLRDLAYLEGRIELEPEVEDYEEKIFERVEPRTSVRFVASREAIARARPMRIFLSHKGIDRPRIREFAVLLRELGFQPWLDEDALVAGHSLDRGLLQGFSESCAAVFFITPSFRDESFLAQEIEYAIAQHRDRGARFAVITLVFADESGNRGVVPELLKRFVWKMPNSDLEALREILRALPIEVGPAKWRI